MKLIPVLRRGNQGHFRRTRELKQIRQSRQDLRMGSLLFVKFVSTSSVNAKVSMMPGNRNHVKENICEFDTKDDTESVM